MGSSHNTPNVSGVWWEHERGNGISKKLPPGIQGIISGGSGMVWMKLSHIDGIYSER